MRIRPMKFTEVQRRLESAGFNIVSQKGSHAKFVLKKGGAIRTAVIPKHKEITVGTLKSILRQAGISWEDFEKL